MGVKEIMLQDTPPEAIVAMVRRDRRRARPALNEEPPMESWTFPPRYDPDYLPPRGSRYWFPQRETMPAAERERGDPRAR